MPPTMNEVLERLGLSDDQRAALAPVLEENQQLKTKLGEVTKKSRQDAVATRVKELQDAKFPPGFCRTYEEIALGDDGATASLNLSDDSGNKTGDKEYTVTDVAERLIAALPKDDSGKLAFADMGNQLLQSPLSGRPPLDAKEQAEIEAKNDPNRARTADEWLSEVAAIDPGLAQNVEQTFQFSTQKGA